MKQKWLLRQLKEQELRKKRRRKRLDNLPSNWLKRKLLRRKRRDLRKRKHREKQKNLPLTIN